MANKKPDSSSNKINTDSIVDRLKTNPHFTKVEKAKTKKYYKPASESYKERWISDIYG